VHWKGNLAKTLNKLFILGLCFHEFQVNGPFFQHFFWVCAKVELSLFLERFLILDPMWNLNRNCIGFVESEFGRCLNVGGYWIDMLECKWSAFLLVLGWLRLVVLEVCIGDDTVPLGPGYILLGFFWQIAREDAGISWLIDLLSDSFYNEGSISFMRKCNV